MICDGSCKEYHNGHEGAVKTVYVVDKKTNHDWGEFNYCDVAIAEDIKRGFSVKVIDQPAQQCK